MCKYVSYAEGIHETKDALTVSAFLFDICIFLSQIRHRNGVVATTTAACKRLNLIQFISHYGNIIYPVWDSSQDSIKYASDIKHDTENILCVSHET